MVYRTRTHPNTNAHFEVRGPRLFSKKNSKIPRPSPPPLITNVPSLNLADQTKQQSQRACHVHDLSVWNKPLIDTCQYCSTSPANQSLRSLANAGFQNRGVCLQAFPSFFPLPLPPLSFFGSRFMSRAAKTGLSLLRNQMETLATQATEIC